MAGVTFSDWEASLGGKAAHQALEPVSFDGVLSLYLKPYTTDGHDPSSLTQGLSKIAGCPILATYQPNLTLEVAGKSCVQPVAELMRCALSILMQQKLRSFTQRRVFNVVIVAGRDHLRATCPPDCKDDRQARLHTLHKFVSQEVFCRPSLLTKDPC